MKNNDYLIPGIAAIILAFLFPLSWFSLIGSDVTNIENIKYDVGLGVTSVLFLIVGIVSIFIYYYFMQLLHDHHNYRKADFAFIAMMVVLAFYGGGFIVMAVLLVYFISKRINDKRNEDFEDRSN